MEMTLKKQMGVVMMFVAAATLVSFIPADALASGGQAFASSASKIEKLLQDAKVWIRIACIIGILATAGMVFQQGGIKEAGKGIIGLLAFFSVLLGVFEIVNLVLGTSSGALF